MQTTTNLDRAAAIGSIACIVHCLALPILAISLPFLAAVAEAEWVHRLFTALAIAASASVIALAPSARLPGFLIPAGIGIAVIGGALFVERWGIDETLPTVIGGSLVAYAHIRRLVG